MVGWGVWEEVSEDAGCVKRWVEMGREFIVSLGWREPPLMEEFWEEVRRRLQILS